MAPNPKAQYEEGENVLCFHGSMLYAAKVLKVELKEEGNRKAGHLYRIHYKGWKGTWDDWVADDRMKKLTDESLEMKQTLIDQQKLLEAPKKTSSASHKRKSTASAVTARGDSIQDSEDRSTSAAAAGKATKRGREEVEKEESFLSRPSVKIHIPDTIKSLMVDDWENVTKNMRLVPLPAKFPVSRILADYTRMEVLNRPEGSPEEDLLTEVTAGLRDYFNRALGRILLYRFERQQWLEMHSLMLSDQFTVTQKGPNFSLKSPVRDGVKAEDVAGKDASDVYGAEHLCRLFVTMPELLAQTNMDAQSLNRLRNEIEKMAKWLGKYSKSYFTQEYEVAGPQYEGMAKTSG